MAHIQDLTVRHYRALKDVTTKGMRSLNVVLGPNGCGKSTLFDVLGFLGECLTGGVRRAVEDRGSLAQLRSRGTEGTIVIELRYRESDLGVPRRKRAPLITPGSPASSA